MTVPRLDILLYAHDGRGLGHVSRSAAIGMALRRLYPDLRVCLLTGCRQTEELIQPAQLDWLKLPAYETEVVDGISRGISGPSNYTDQELAAIRRRQIGEIFSLFRPRLFLTDHTPQGKHKELVPALSDPSGDRTICVLGVRGVVGTVPQASLPIARDLFGRSFSQLLWYGDSTILGREHLDTLSRRFSTQAIECGYVSRLAELSLLPDHHPAAEKVVDCTISIPWLGEHSEGFIANLTEALRRAGPDIGSCRIYIGAGASDALLARMHQLRGCTVEPFGSSYLHSLCRSRSAIIFGGYNSLIDVLAAGIPALVVLRAMRDREQQEHLTALTGAGGANLSVLDEKTCSPEAILRGLLALLGGESSPLSSALSLDGATRAAHALAALLSGAAV